MKESARNSSDTMLETAEQVLRFAWFCFTWPFTFEWKGPRRKLVCGTTLTLIQVGAIGAFWISSKLLVHLESLLLLVVLLIVGFILRMLYGDDDKNLDCHL